MITRFLRAPRQLRITRPGLVFLVLTVGVGVGALNTGNNLLYLTLSYLLAFIILSGILSEQVLGALTVRRLPFEGGHAGEPLELRYEVTSLRRNSNSLAISEGPRGPKGQALLGWVERGEPHVALARYAPVRRGPLELTVIRVSTTFPFGLFEKSRDFPAPATLVIWPSRRAPKADPTFEADSKGEGARSNRVGAGSELRELRELRESEDGRRIHWKKSAMGGRLVVAEREEEGFPQITLHLPKLPLGPALDEQCAAATRSVLDHLARGYEVGLTLEQERIPPSRGATHERQLLTSLGRLGFEGAP